MLPAAQTVAPVHPSPPHCPYFTTVAPADVATAELEVVVATLAVMLVLETFTVVEVFKVELVADVVACVVAEPDEAGDEPPADPPVHTAGPGGV